MFFNTPRDVTSNTACGARRAEQGVHRKACNAVRATSRESKVELSQLTTRLHPYKQSICFACHTRAQIVLRAIHVHKTIGCFVSVKKVRQSFLPICISVYLSLYKIDKFN